MADTPLKHRTPTNIPTRSPAMPMLTANPMLTLITDADGDADTDADSDSDGGWGSGLFDVP